ncbi:calcium/sodium antiporter [Synechococcales cyanobacterium C]|uniref:Calcium/sodium antiporter n=1 Tax=Petrachloros mirabilis ULC683 TaxID=2781853 RepID=A0A8K2A911_9CYAN|nr:calcium/sodium antiporter [Petrachloros mirabilis]NCJ08631.1 calcium/sodium antiporter [Petrachloros mirabilis ULC683]
MDSLAIVAAIAGLVFLVAGAEALVRGASRLAAIAGISPLVIGLTIVAYGTSAPELFVSLQANWLGQADISIGNVVGSNIFNVLFILGLSSLVVPLVVAQQLIRLDVPIMIGVSLLTLLLGMDRHLSPAEGMFLFMGGVGYTLFLIWHSRKEHNEAVQAEYDGAYPPQVSSPRQWLINFAWIGIGLVGLALGSRWLLAGATSIAKALGLSELIIGLTIIAIGTSLPELCTSVVASIRGERDIAVGNVVGSNIFNILVVLGVASIASPQGVHISGAALRFDIPMMIAVAIACLPIFFTGNRIERWEGLLFMGYYVAYTTYLIMEAMNHEQLPLFSTILGTFVIPLTVLTLVIVTVREVRAHSHPHQ